MTAIRLVRTITAVLLALPAAGRAADPPRPTVSAAVTSEPRGAEIRSRCWAPGA